MATVIAGTPLSAPAQPPGGYRFPPIDPEKWYSVQEVALRYSTGDDYIRRTFRARLKNGHEDCTFFAVTLDGIEAPLKVVARSNVKEAAYQDAPLH